MDLLLLLLSLLLHYRGAGYRCVYVCVCVYSEQIVDGDDVDGHSVLYTMSRHVTSVLKPQPNQERDRTGACVSSPTASVLSCCLVVAVVVVDQSIDPMDGLNQSINAMQCNEMKSNQLIDRSNQ